MTCLYFQGRKKEAMNREYNKFLAKKGVKRDSSKDRVSL